MMQRIFIMFILIYFISPSCGPTTDVIIPESEQQTKSNVYQPPVALKRPFIFEKHGYKINDNYHWLKDKTRQNKKVIDYLTADEEIILDTNKLAKGYSYYMLGDYQLSEDNRYLALTIDTDGSETYRLYIKDLKTKIILTDTVSPVGHFCWASDNQTIFYSIVNETNRPDKIFRHILGTPHMEDDLIYHEKDDAFFVSLYKTKSRRYLIICCGSETTTENRFLRSDKPTSQFQLIQLREDGIQYYISHGGDFFYIRTNAEDAKNFKIMRTSIKSPGRKYWQDFIEHHETVYDYNMITRKKELLKQQEVLGGFDSTNYLSERVYAQNPDGTKVPISLVYKKELLQSDGSNPLLLNGYGAYGISNDPYFSSTRLTLLDRGFVFALGHVRGGRELGEKWYEQGKLLNKKNTITDLIACADFLVKKQYTSSEKLVLHGSSAGGLLVGAVANVRPDLCHIIIADVPFVDVLNTMLDPTLSATVSEYDEWGNPKIKEYFEYIYSYCPYQNVSAQDYPHIIIQSGFYDTRVNYWEPAKWVAKLRDLKTDSNKIIMKINMSGHGGASGRYDHYRELAFTYAVMLDLLGIRS